jgi:ABC-type oligopeptide transport system substrate-binding subunit
VRVRVLPDPARYFDYVSDTRHRAQAGFDGWIADFLSPSSFFDPFTCARLARNTINNVNVSQLCDRALDTAYDAAVAAHGADANARWAALDRRALAVSPAVPLYYTRSLILLSGRVGNAQLHPLLGALLDRMWVR